VRDLSSHPLRRLLHAGVRVTVNSDDPPFFGGYVNANYLAASQVLALDVDDVIALAHNSFTGSFADLSAVRSWSERLEVYRDEHHRRDELGRRAY
jgi:adenosine deaminase